MPTFVHDAGPAWKAARGASVVATALFALGLVTSALCVARGACTSRRWPRFELRPVAASRALLLVWLAGIWLTYATPATGRLFSHYLIVTFPVPFAIEALALADLVAAVRSNRFRSLATIGALCTLAVVAAAHTAFTQPPSIATSTMQAALPATTASCIGTRPTSRTSSRPTGSE